MNDATAQDLPRRVVGDVFPAKFDRAGAGAQQAGEGTQQRALAGAVGADQTHRFAFIDVEIDTPEHLDVAISGCEVLDAEQRRRHWPTIWRSAKREPR